MGVAPDMAVDHCWFRNFLSMPYIFRGGGSGRVNNSRWFIPVLLACPRHVRLGSRLRENSEIEFANGSFVSTSIDLKNKNAGDGYRDKTIEKTILRAFRARTFSRSQGHFRTSAGCVARFTLRARTVENYAISERNGRNLSHGFVGKCAQCK
jgi:hypothetical protein